MFFSTMAFALYVDVRLLIAALVIVLLLFGIFFRLRNSKIKTLRSDYEKEIEKLKKKDDINLKDVFKELDVGIIVYSQDRRIIISNDAALSLLSTSELPKNLGDFLSEYGNENGLKARFVLSKGPTSAVINIGEKLINLSIRQIQLIGSGKICQIVLLQDITDSELQERQRKEFVANVSHELKTPLTTIITYSESLLDWGLDEKHKDGIRKDMIRIHDDAIRMQDLVTDLLLLSSIDSRKLQKQMEPLDFVSLTRQTVDRMQVQSSEKKIKLSFTKMTNYSTVFGDRSSLERVISNLLSNAIKYTDSGGSVKVYVGRVLDSVYVKVTDNGSGIAQQHLQLIFNRFYRVDMTGSRMYGGTGLGLAIAKELVEMHMGQISVQSSLGQGSTFTVMLPLASKVYSDTLTDVLSGLSLNDELLIAAAKDLVSQLNSRGESIDSLTELSDEKLEALIEYYNNENSEDDLKNIDRGKDKASGNGYKAYQTKD